ncbi:translation initiation factor IF-2 [Arsenicibacter rosenii]|uniref:Translation initiation factor IF-2 n=1 Tax=Arsenicibacter rosenii TaxID=1750698 RepID=A0A1S2VNF8_9BACT|nr:translation initiation factor IF-2 [Arsenicibacter rosenii]OIN59706.1 translation initiation factor IF-2 [Arsenicibacter rosenii]
MAEDKSMRLNQVAKILNVGLSTVVSRLSAKGFKVESNPNAKINAEQLDYLAKEFKSTELQQGNRKTAETVAEPTRKQEDVILYRRDDAGRPVNSTPQPASESKPAPAEVKPEAASGSVLPGLKVLGKIDLNAKPGSSAISSGTPAQAAPAKPATPPAEHKPVAPAPEPVKAPVQEATPAPVQPVAPPAPPVEAKAPVQQQPEPPKPQPAEPKPEVKVAQPTVPVQEKPQPAPAPKPEPVAPVVAEKAVQPEPSKPVETPKPVEPKPAGVSAPVVADKSNENKQAEPTKPIEAVLPKAEQTQPEQRSQSRQQNQTPAPQSEQRNAARPSEPQRTPEPETPAAHGTDHGSDIEPETIRAEGRHQLGGLKILGKIELPVEPTRSSNNDRDKKKKRKRIRGKEGVPVNPAQGQPNAGQGQGQGQRPHGQGQGQGQRPHGQGQGQRPQGQGQGQRPQGQGQGQRPEHGGGNRNQQDRPQGAGQQQGGPRNDRQNQGPRNDRNDNRPNQNAGTGGTAPANTGGGGSGANKKPAQGGNNRNDRNKRDRREAPTDADVKKSIQETRARMAGNQPNRGADRRRDRRRERADRVREQAELDQQESKILKVTEFVSANDLASLMDVSVNEVIGTCMSLGMFVSINQRLDAEAITVIADEFGYDVQFVTAEEEVESGIVEEADAPETLEPRAPIVTIMGHVDHGKTSLLDYIRRAKVAAGEAGGITQHIGAYSVKTKDGRMVTFLDTPGHEAFTAMRARGAKVTDVVIIVIAADDSIMPQTREAINHAQVAGVPIVFAFSKVDKPGANTEKIREELANMNMLVEDWGGKYQAQEISSKSGLGIDDLLEKVLLEAELLELKANPNRKAVGTVIEASLDKGRGYVSTVLIENGTLRQGDIMLVGAHYGRIRAMTDDIGGRIKEAGPSTPVQILGLPGAPQAGDKFNVMETEREAREIANKREQLLREQSLRTRKHITLEEIGRRKAIGSFKELNIIVKGDVDGSVEALSDSLLQLSTGEVQVNILQKAVGQISESDVLLASASDAIIVGFQVRPSVNARRLAEQEQIEIRLYSIIYDAINEIRDAMEGLLAPTTEEVITGNIDVREVFKISKIGTVAGCMVTEGTIKRNNKVRVIRDFIVIHTGEISALKRFKDDVGEVRQGYECGLSVKNFNDIEIGDQIEAFEIKEVKRTL